MTDEFQVTWGKNESLCLNLLVSQVRVHPNSSHLNLIGWESWRNGSQKKIKVLLKKKTRVEVGRQKPTTGQCGSPGSTLQLPQQDRAMECPLWSVLESHGGNQTAWSRDEKWHLWALVPGTRAGGGLLTSAALPVSFPQFPLKVITWDCMSCSLNYYTDTPNYVQEKSTVRWGFKNEYFINSTMNMEMGK